MAHTSTNRSRHFTWLELNKSNMLYTKNMLKTKTNKKYARKKKRERESQFQTASAHTAKTQASQIWTK